MSRSAERGGASEVRSQASRQPAARRAPSSRRRSRDDRARDMREGCDIGVRDWGSEYYDYDTEARDWMRREQLREEMDEVVRGEANRRGVNKKPDNRRSP